MKSAGGVARCLAAGVVAQRPCHDTEEMLKSQSPSNIEKSNLTNMALKIALPDPDPLKAPLQSLSRQSLSEPCKLAIVKEFWTTPSASTNWSKIPFDTYFEYFEDQCRLALHNWDRYDISSLNFSHVVYVGKLIKREKTRADIEAELRSAIDGACEDLCPEVVDLTVRLLLMIQIGRFRNVLMPGQQTLPWADGPLSATLHRYTSPVSILRESVSMDNTFTARSVDKIAGIRVVWTSNLLDHLRMGDNDTSVSLFHHASFLNFQKDS
jgi:hypothetical protein